jgi:voltage-gated potassium channel
MDSTSVGDTKIGLLNLLVIILSIYVLGAIVVDTFFDLSKETSELLNFIDNSICVFFLIEFAVRFYIAKNKLKFMRWGWIDLLASIPMIGIFRAGRILRLIRLLRVIRAFKSTQNFVNHIFSNKIEGTFTSISVLSILLVIFSAIAILQVENDPNSNIKTAEDAIWWAYVTITTVWATEINFQLQQKEGLLLHF